MKTSIELQNILEEHISPFLPEHNFRDVLLYSLIPSGKLFRPKLVHALAQDLDSLTDNHLYLASSLEIHHTYTLIHDDLPAMDDDDYRRGKLASHKKFNEYSAILAGDALLNISFGLLSKINHPNLNQLISLYSEYTGAKGLILGQVLDLEIQKQSIERIIQIHTLKTARLIQLALEGSFLLSNSTLKQSTISQLGLSIGISFQLLDDLSELAEEINGHEMKINPFLNLDSNILLKLLNEHLENIQSIIKENKLECISLIMKEYFSKMLNLINSGESQIKSHLKDFNISQLSL